MESILLRTKPLPEAEETEMQWYDEQVLSLAATNLNYRPTRSFSFGSAVHEALRAADINPYHPGSVRLYKAVQFLRINAAPLLLVVGTILATYYGSSWCWQRTTTAHAGSFAETGWCALMVMLIVVGLVVPLGLLPIYLRRWQRVGIGSYSDPIPMHVLNKAISLKTELVSRGMWHTYSFSVEYLETAEERRERQREIREKRRELREALARDPFLVLRGEGREIYVEVWGEKDFECKNRMSRWI